MLNYVQRGENITVPAAPYNVASGGGILVGSMFGVATDAATNGSQVVIATSGVFTLPKVSALAIAVGDPLFWDDTNKLVTETAQGNVRIGVAVAAAVNPSGAVNVRLNGSF